MKSADSASGTSLVPYASASALATGAQPANAGALATGACSFWQGVFGRKGRPSSAAASARRFRHCSGVRNMAPDPAAHN